MKSLRNSLLNDGQLEVITGRLMGIDFGLKRIGLAICDPEGRVAVGAGWIEGTPKKSLIPRIIVEAGKREVEGIVVGQPAVSRGNEEVILGVNRLAKDLAGRGYKVVLWGEGYTTASALTARKFYGGKSSSDKGWADEASAIILLQDYLAWVRGKNG